MFRKKEEKRKGIVSRLFKFIVATVVIVGVLGAAAVALINVHVVRASEGHIVSKGHKFGDIDAIVVLGASVQNGKPTRMLQDRLDVGLELYEGGVSERIVVSGDGDGIDQYYNETKVMRKYLVERGVSEGDIIVDSEGFTTMESMRRMRDVFGMREIVVVTQRYHLYRAVYIGRELGLGTVGVASDLHEYKDMGWHNTREVGARVKAFSSLFFDKNSDTIVEYKR